jgi:hypothetical protein
VRSADVPKVPGPERTFGRNFVDVTASPCDDARLAAQDSDDNDEVIAMHWL